MASADEHGNVNFLYGYETGGIVRWIVTFIGAPQGISFAREEEMPIEPFLKYLKKLQDKEPDSFVRAEVPAEYARWRISEAVGRTKALPPTIAYWRTKLDGASPMPHPSEDLPRAGTAEEIRELPLRHPATVIWRLSLGATVLAVDALVAAVRGDSEKSEETFRNSPELAAAQSVAFTDEVVQDHVQRLLDLGYVLHLRGRAESALVLAAADDLRAHGGESQYARCLFDKTMYLLIQALQENKGVEPE
jgi:hypothetical protein